MGKWYGRVRVCLCGYGCVGDMYILNYVFMSDVILYIYGELMSIHVAVGLVPVKRFNHEGLHQLQNWSSR